jgi:hypothetical protein
MVADCGLPPPTTRSAVVRAVQVYALGTLAQAVGILSGQLPAEPTAAEVEELFVRSS